jgi:glycosyltransferase 2 family protein
MAYRFRVFTNFIIGIVLTVILLYVAFRGTDFDVLWTTMRNVRIWWILSAFPLLIASHFVRAWRWQLLLIPVKDRVELNNAFSSLIIGYLANNLMPRSGEIVRPYTLGKIEGISKASSFGSVFLERMIDLFSLLVGLGLLFVLFRRTLTEQFPWWSTLNIAAIAVTIVFICAIMMLLYKRDLMLKITGIFLMPFSERIRNRCEEMFHSFVDGMLIIRERKNVLSIVALTVAMWLLYILTAYLPLLAFDLTGVSVDLVTGFVLTMVTSLSVIVPTPGATGSYHTFTVETLTRLYGFQREIALGYATMTHAVGYFSVILVGLLYLVRYNFRMREVLSNPGAVNDTPDQRTADAVSAEEEGR